VKFHAGPTLKDEIVTVGGTDDTFSTIQKAIDWFKRYRITGDCRIDVDAGTYDEAVVFDDLLIAAGATLTLRGDTRVLAGLSYVDGADCNQAGLTNGGSGACGLANAVNDITVTGGGGNPDFDADGWGSGDTILVYDNAGAITEETIDSVLNNVITLTGAAPAVGNDGTAICLLPNRRIERTSAGSCVQANGIRGLSLDGFYLVSSTGASCHGLEATNLALVTVDNIAIRAEDFGFYFYLAPGKLTASSGAVSAWECSVGFQADNEMYIDASNSVVVNCTTGYNTIRNSLILADAAVAVNCTTGFAAVESAHFRSDGGTARQDTTGYDATFGGYIYAPNTNANNNGNGADYDPLPAGFPGSNQGNDYSVVYAS
jgi:hypothetical protein